MPFVTLLTGPGLPFRDLYRFPELHPILHHDSGRGLASRLPFESNILCERLHYFWQFYTVPDNTQHCLYRIRSSHPSAGLSGYI